MQSCPGGVVVAVLGKLAKVDVTVLIMLMMTTVMVMMLYEDHKDDEDDDDGGRMRHLHFGNSVAWPWSAKPVMGWRLRKS